MGAGVMGRRCGASVRVRGKSEKPEDPGGRRGHVSSLLLTLGLWVPVVQVFCVIPKYIQTFLRKTLGTREWPAPSPAARSLPSSWHGLTRPGVLPVLNENAGAG